MVEREPSRSSKSTLMKENNKLCTVHCRWKKVYVRDHPASGAVTALFFFGSRSNGRIVHNESFIIAYALSAKIAYTAAKTGFVGLVDCCRQ